jgi:GNAT superfamily N-acetyltransferase
MERHLGNTRWRIVHTDCFTPDGFLAHLAFDDFEERPVTIQMALQGGLSGHPIPIELRPVASNADWDALLQLVLVDHAEGRRTNDRDISAEVSAGMVVGYRAKSDAFHFQFAVRDGIPVAYGGYAIATNGAGMIEDLFTLQSARRQGIASTMIAVLIDRLRAAGCHTISLGALATERPKHLYARLGFHAVTLARTWVRELPVLI